MAQIFECGQLTFDEAVKISEFDHSVYRTIALLYSIYQVKKHLLTLIVGVDLHLG